VANDGGPMSDFDKYRAMSDNDLARIVSGNMNDEVKKHRATTKWQWR
jgi:hypothetical protein